jgi:hypothetical protein
MYFIGYSSCVSKTLRLVLRSTESKNDRTIHREEQKYGKRGTAGTKFLGNVAE